MTRADLIVVGGGPAGSAAAITAARGGMSVVLFERSAGPVTKVCGEVLSEAGVELAIGLGGAGLAAAARYDAVRFSDGARPGRSIDVPLRSGARGVSRAVLDEGLLAAGRRAGVDVRRGVRVSRRERRAEDWVVCGTGEAGELAAAPLLVLATGRTARPGRGSWIGRRSLAVGPHDAGVPLTLEFDRYGYVGTARLADGATTATGLWRYRNAPATRSDRAPATVTGESVLGTPPFRLGIHRTPAEAGVYRTGDALAAWPPLVGDGMTAGMMSGIELGELLASRAAPDADCWPAWWSARHGGTLRAALALHALLARPVTRRPLWRLAATFAGLAGLIESGVRLPRYARAATTAPCIRGG